jgi:hypothetical protein
MWDPWFLMQENELPNHCNLLSVSVLDKDWLA